MAGVPLCPTSSPTTLNLTVAAKLRFGCGTVESASSNPSKQQKILQYQKGLLLTFNERSPWLSACSRPAAASLSSVHRRQQVQL